MLDDRPETADLEVMEIQNGGGSPMPSLALTDTDFGGQGEPETSRSTLLGSAWLLVASLYVIIMWPSVSTASLFKS